MAQPQVISNIAPIVCDGIIISLKRAEVGTKLGQTGWLKSQHRTESANEINDVLYHNSPQYMGLICHRQDQRVTFTATFYRPCGLFYLQSTLLPPFRAYPPRSTLNRPIIVAAAPDRLCVLCVKLSSPGVVREIEYPSTPFPCRFTLECLFNEDRLNMGRRASLRMLECFA